VSSHESWVMGQVTDGSRGSQNVTHCHL